MKLSIVVAGLFAAAAMASPGAASLKRAFKDVEVNGTVVKQGCVLCPCDGWTGKCKCVPNGCCCKH